MPLRPVRLVLAAVHPGPGADRVIRSAALAAARCGAALHVVHALEGDRWMEGSPESLLVARVSHARHRLREELDAALGDGAAVSIHVEEGRAHRVILRLARELGADLLVVGANRSRVLEAHFLGTSAERVLHGSAVPVLVVREELRLPLGSVAVPTDARDPSVGAVQAAMAWSARLAEGDAAAPVRLVYAGWELDAHDDPTLEERVVRPALAAAAERAAEGVRTAGSAAPPPVTVEVEWGADPAGVICRWAKREGPGLLVMASHGSGGLRRLLAGSVAQSIARQAPAPVLLLPPDRWDRGEPEDGAA